MDARILNLISDKFAEKKRELQLAYETIIERCNESHAAAEVAEVVLADDYLDGDLEDYDGETSIERLADMLDCRNDDELIELLEDYEG